MKLEVGFLGYQFMCKAHANALARLPIFFSDAPVIERSVLVGRTPDALAEAAERFGFETVETDWDAALDDIDVFYNLGPTHIHTEPTIAALERDIHVFCEKPLAPRLSGAEEVVTAARGSDATTAIGFNYRYVPALRLAKRMTDEGTFGTIVRFRGQYLQNWQTDPSHEWVWRNDSQSAGTGSLGDQGSHTLDLARWFVGDIERVTGHLETFIAERPSPDGDGTRPVTTDDEYSALAAFENGAMGVFEASRVATGHKSGNTIEVYGSEGGFRFSMDRLNELEVWTADSDGIERILVTDDDHPYMDAWWPTGHVIGWEHTFVHENYEFLTAIANDEPYEPDLADGLLVQRLIDAIERSDDAGTWVTP
jgi:predicted dehydrogenase